MASPARFFGPAGESDGRAGDDAVGAAGGVVHFSRLVASGPTGTPEGQEERHRSYLQHIDRSTALLALVQPQVIVLAHTASSQTPPAKPVA
jgi:hypothetical protein